MGIIQSGIFCRAYSDERENGEISKDDHKRLAILFESMDGTNLSGYLKRKLEFTIYPQFQEYKRIFYSK